MAPGGLPMSEATATEHLADPALIAERVHAATAEIASMCPVVEEARMAARVVTADAQARECSRHARAGCPTIPSPP